MKSVARSAWGWLSVTLVALIIVFWGWSKLVGDSRSRAEWVISTQKCAVRGTDGLFRIQPLEPAATSDSMRDRLAEMQALPVAIFPDGSSRLVTRDLEVRLSGPEAKVLAGHPELEVVARPDYAPGWVILRAADPFAALAAVPGLRATPGVMLATVAFARQQVPRRLPNDPLISNQWHLQTSGTASPGTDVNVVPVWNYGGGSGIRGAGISIGVVDDGLEQTHPDLAANVNAALAWDWNGGDADPSPGLGDNHGTACAGLAAARGDNSLGVSGVAPEATLVGLRLIAGPSTDAEEAAAMVWKKDLIQVKTNSWGPADTGALLEGPGPLTLAAMESAAATGRGGRGTIFVWAAGNGYAYGDNSNYDGYANSIYTIATGAIDSTGNAANYSEAGANVVVCAPSDDPSPALGITTTDLTGSAGYNSASTLAGGDYAHHFGGTSAASPIVAGVVALMLERNPQLGWRDVQEILIRSATRVRPADSGWATNGAGLAFHPRFGAGLVNAAAAVAMAEGWQNLPAAQSVSQSIAGPRPIPENNAAGVLASFHLTASNLRVEHVTLTADISHTSRGNLEITLTSPAGTVSRLAEVHNDTNDDFPAWTFSSVRNWGEFADGEWILKIADRSPSGNTSGGTLQSAVLRVFGSSIVPQNPPPFVVIESPVDGAIFTPGSPVDVTVSATDLTVDGSPGVVAEVALLVDGAVVASRTTPPYTFQLALVDGPHELRARATDDMGAAADSVPTAIRMENRPPVITAASLSGIGQAYADQDLRVQTVAANDPDGTVPVIDYQWQTSADATTWRDAVGETALTLPADPGRAGQLWRCRLIASDGTVSSSPFFTASVNLLTRPGNFVQLGSTFHYASGLVVAGTPFTPTRQAVLHEFSQGPPGGNSDWVEILVLKQTDFRYWDLSDTTNMLVFSNSPTWAAVPAGTLVVVYNGSTTKDPALPVDDSDPADGRMVVSSTDTNLFDPAFNSWIPLSNSGDVISLNDAASVRVHSLSYGNSCGPGVHLPAVGSGTAAFFAGDTEGGIDDAASWEITPSAGAVTPGAPNNPANAALVFSLRNGVPTISARFSLAPESALPSGLALDPVSGVLSGTVTAAPGNTVVRIQRTGGNGAIASQAFILTIGPAGGYDAWIAGVADPAPLADPDGDGRPNLVEYGAGTSPVVADAPWVASVELGFIALEYQRSKLHSDVEIVPQWSATLEDWKISGIHLEAIGETDDFQFLRATMLRDPAHPRAFLRLRATRVP